MAPESDEPFWYESRDLEILAEMPNYYRWIMDFFGPHLRGRILEIGAGTGSISELLLPFAEGLELVEPSPNLVQRLEARFEHQPGVQVHGQTLEQFVEQAPANAFDSIVMVNVLEHIRDDIDAVRKLSDSLTAGGHLLLFVPALPFLYSRLDKLVGHYRRYKRGTMRDVLSAAGLEIVTCRYMDFAGILPWWLTFTLAGRTSFDGAGVRIYDRFGIPATRAVEGLLPIPIGKNIVAVARKPV